MIKEIIVIASPLIVALIGGFFGYKQAKLHKQITEENARIEKRAEDRKKESLLSMKLIHANTQLTIGVAMAQKNGHANGEIESGLKAVKDASDEYNAFLLKMANEHLQ